MAEEILLAHADQIDPAQAEDYIKVGGFKGLEKARG